MTDQMQLYVDPGYVDPGYIAGATILAELHKLNGGAWVNLFELDLTPLGGTVLRFHPGTNALRQPVVWQGNTYTPFPIVVDGYAVSGSGQFARPRLVASNVLGVMTALADAYDDFVGMKLTRKRTMVKYLDAVNFAAQRNLATYSETLNNAAWVASGVTVTADAATAPTGDTAADRMNETATTATHSITRTFAAMSPSAGTVCCASINARPIPGAPTRRYLSIQFLAGGGYTTPRSVTFDLHAQTYTTPPAGFAAVMVPSDKADMVRCALYGPADAAGSVTVGFYASAAMAAPAAYLGDTGNGLILWGAQVEVGALTDYQPVTGSTYSRNPYADPYSYLPDETYYVIQRVSETPEAMELELGSALDLQGVMIPKRQMLGNTCPWQYRDTNSCGYAGGAVADKFDQPTTVLANDQCSHTLSGCKLRFGENAVLPFGGFPGSGVTRQ